MVKDLSLYIGVCTQAIESMLKNPLWNGVTIRIYIDASVNNDSSDFLDVKREFINFCQDNESRIELVEVEMPYFVHPSKWYHHGLLGTIFRFLPLLDSDIEKCFVGDSDNLDSQYLIDALNLFYQRDGSTSIDYGSGPVIIDSDMMVVRPLLYSRRNYNNNCIPNIFAGVFGFKKENGKVLNYKIWNNIFLFMEKLFDSYYGLSIDKKSIGCDPFIYNNSSTAPFEFGFEEQALSNVLLPNYIKISGKKASILPVCWFHPMPIAKHYASNIWGAILNILSNEFLENFKDILSIDVDIKNAKILEWTFFDNNLHIMNLILNLVKSLNNTSSVSGVVVMKKPDGTTVNVYESGKSIADIERLLGVIPLSVIYPGFELNIDKPLYDDILDKLLKGIKLDFNTYLKFSQTHTFKDQVLEIIKHYCM